MNINLLLVVLPFLASAGFPLEAPSADTLTLTPPRFELRAADGVGGIVATLRLPATGTKASIAMRIVGKAKTGKIRVAQASPVGLHATISSLWLTGFASADAPPEKITHSFFAAGNETYIQDSAGKPTWRYPLASRDGWVLPNRNVLLAVNKCKEYPGGAALEVTPEGKVVFEFKGTQSEVNTVQPLDGGKVLLTEAGARPRLLEVDRAGKVLVEVALQAQTRDHHLQTRMARKLPNGNYLVPQLLDKVVREYTPGGKVVWEVKTPNMPFTAIRLDNGNTLIACTLGNLVIEVDGDGKTVWQISNDDLPGKPINDACGAQRLPNGNTVITSHHAVSGEVKLLEVTPAKKVVWTHTDDKKFGIHHFQILDTNGKPLEGRPLR